MTAPRKQLGYANVESKERFPHSHSLHGCGILQRQTKTDVYTKDWTLPIFSASSMPLMIIAAVWNRLNPSIGRIRCLIRR